MFGLEPLTGAYGRRYSSLQAMQADFDKGLDFRTPSGAYTSKRELPTVAPGMKKIRCRFGGPLGPLTETDFLTVACPVCKSSPCNPLDFRHANVCSRCGAVPLDCKCDFKKR